MRTKIGAFRPPSTRFMAAAVAATLALSVGVLSVGSAGSSNSNAGRGLSGLPCQTSNTCAADITGVVENGAGASLVAFAGGERKTAVADAAGNYIFKNLAPGTYTVGPADAEAAAFDFVPTSVSVTLSGNGNTGIAATMGKWEQEGISEDLLASLDKVPDTFVPLNQIILDNGIDVATYSAQRGIVLGASKPAEEEPAESEPSSSPSSPPSQLLPVAEPAFSSPGQKRRDVIAKMLMEAKDYACERSPAGCNPPRKWDLPAGPLGAAVEPQQKGLTYVYGGCHTVACSTNGVPRQKPLGGCCPGNQCFSTAGMDCSGLVRIVTQAAGIVGLPDANAARMADPSYWKLPEPWGLKMTKLKAGAAIQPGDLVNWGSHVGIADSPTTFISSTGTRGKSPADTNCLKCVNPPKGPRSLSFAAWGSAPKTVLRLAPSNESEYAMVLRPWCHRGFDNYLTEVQRGCTVSGQKDTACSEYGRFSVFFAEGTADAVVCPGPNECERDSAVCKLGKLSPGTYRARVRLEAGCSGRTTGGFDLFVRECNPPQYFDPPGVGIDVCPIEKQLNTVTFVKANGDKDTPCGGLRSAATNVARTGILNVGAEIVTYIKIAPR